MPHHENLKQPTLLNITDLHHLWKPQASNLMEIIDVGWAKEMVLSRPIRTTVL